MAKIAVVAIGGNSLIKDQGHQTVPDQFEAVRETLEFSSVKERDWHS